ncbi:MAG: hypothetical protein EAX96_05860 [Candidatus Lokiarchaeota archaeon]|nr:hypothetical protein [Candidatus Lokiarchaeota archaeon]
MALKADFFKYLVLVIVAAFIISFFYMCTVGILEGELNALFLLIFTWVFLLIISKFFASKSYQVEEFFRYIIIGALVHVGISTAILIWHYHPVTSIIFCVTFMTIIMIFTFKEPIITWLYELNVISLTYEKIKPKALEINHHYYMLAEKPYRFIAYVSIPTAASIKLIRALKFLAKTRVHVSFEYYGHAKELECHIGLSSVHEDSRTALTTLQAAVDTMVDLCTVLKIKYRVITLSEELERIYFLPLLAYKHAEIPYFEYHRKEQDTIHVKYGKFGLKCTAMQIAFKEGQTFDVQALVEIIARMSRSWHPFWFGIHLTHYTEKQLNKKQYKLKMRFQHAIKKIKNELAMNDGRAQLMQLFSSTFKNPQQDSYLFNFLFRADYEKFEIVKNEVLEFRKGLDLGLWHASFTVILPHEFLITFQKYADVEFIKLNKRQVVNTFKKQPKHGQDLNSNQINTFLGNRHQ